MTPYLHNLDPVLFSIFGLEIRWYSLAYLFGFLFCYWCILFMSQKKLISLNKIQVLDFISASAVAIILGGRLGYCLFYAPENFVTFSSEFPYWEVLSVHKGGMSSHGGIIAVILNAFWFARKNSLSFLALLDVSALPASLSLGIGRLTNFINGELYGRPCKDSCFWPVQFPSEVYEWVQLENVDKLKPLAPALEHINSSSVLWGEWLYNFSEYQGHIYSALSKLIEALQNNHPQVVEVFSQTLTYRYPSQLIQASLEGGLVFIILFILWLKPRPQGVIAASFGIFYSLMRIIGEQFRMPDAHIGFDGFLTRGQWLSFLILIIGLGILFYSLKNHRHKTHGGFLK